MLDDFKHSLRTLRQSPGFTITAVAALALGIGANTAMFTVVNTVLLQPLPYPNSDRIVNVGRPGTGGISEPLFTYWMQNESGLEDMAAYHSGASMNLSGGEKPELVATVAASQNYFRLFGARPILGRTFVPEEDSPKGAPALVLSFSLWQRRFGADPAILGKSIALGGASRTVAGILSPGFHPYPPADVWIPLQADPASSNQAGILTVSARLPAGTTPDIANARIAALGQHYIESHPAQLRIDQKIHCTFLQPAMTGDARPALLILLGAVGFVLLIACANVANLLLTRSISRQREIAIRAALGATRGRITRLMLAESMLLATAGGALGLVIGSWAVRAILVFAPIDVLPRLQEIAAVPAIDPRVAAFAFLITLGTGVLFTLIPAFHLMRGDLNLALNEAGGRTGCGRKQNRIRAALVAMEVATSVVLLCGAVLLIRSYSEMHSVALGFNPNNLLTVETSLAGPGFGNSQKIDRLAQQIVERAELIPGVESAALASALPLAGHMDMIFNIPGRAAQAGGQFTGDVQWRYVSSRYFEVLQVPLLKGRLLRDREPSHAVVISQTMARKFWPDSSPIGQSVYIGPGLGPAYQVGVTEVVGVVGDVRERLNIDPQPVMYQSPSQIPDADMALLNNYEAGAVLIRTRPGVGPLTVSRAVQQVVLETGRLATSKVRTMDQASFDSTASQNFNLFLLSAFAVLALALAAVGIYGVMSYTVEQRTHELGIRAALGATREDTLKLIFAQALTMTLAGVGGGVVVSLWMTRVLHSQLFGVTARDPLTFAVVPVVLAMVAIASASIPALRATRVDPITSLRHSQ